MAVAGTESRWQDMTIECNALTVNGVPVAAAQASNITDPDNEIAVTYTTGDPSITPDGAITIADGGTPTVDELLVFCVELNAAIAALDTKLTAVIAALEGFGVSASS